MAIIDRLQREYSRFITSGGQLILLGVGAHIDTPRGWAGCTALIAAISLFAWMSTYRRARAVDDTPTSRIASAAQGYTELLGRASAPVGPVLVSPYAHQRCLWYRYLVERRQDDKWQNEVWGESDASFILNDGSGECLVAPEGAEVLAAHKKQWTADDRRYTEWLLLGNETIYALGQFRTLGSADLELDREADIGALLAEWKKDRPNLLRRFDLDRNGEIDLREWELVRAQARREVDRMHREARLQSDLHMMHRPADGRLYLISSLAPDVISRRYRWWSLAHVVIFFGALAGFATAMKMSV